MAKHIEVYPSPDGWRFRAIAANGEIVANGEAYTRKWSAKRAARSLFPGWPVIVVR
jgi:uncharacterized protein YegP (UPF0339 family)